MLLSQYSPSRRQEVFSLSQPGNAKSNIPDLAGVAQWIEHRPANQRITSSIPSQGTCLGCRPGPQRGAFERQPHVDVSPFSFSFPSPVSKNK